MGLGGILIWTSLAKNIKKVYPDYKLYFIYNNNISNIRDLIRINLPSEYLIYKNNDDIEGVIPKYSFAYLILRLRNILENNIILINMGDTKFHYWQREDKERTYFKTGKHAIQIACDVFGIGEAELKPRILLTDFEKKCADSLLNENGVVYPYIVIEPNAKKDFGVNKEWFWERWQELVDRLNLFFLNHNSEIKIVQVGVKGSKVLDKVVNLTGRFSFREMAGVLERSLLLITYEGGLVHLARAVETKSLVLISAWEPRELMEYPGNINFYTDIECKNCGLKIPCSRNRKCMESISVDSVYNAVINELNRYLKD